MMMSRYRSLLFASLFGLTVSISSVAGSGCTPTSSQGTNNDEGGNSGNGGKGGSGGTTSSGGSSTSNGGNNSGGTTSSGGSSASNGGDNSGGTSSSGGSSTSNGGSSGNGGSSTSNGGSSTSNGGAAGGSTGSAKCAPTTATATTPTSSGGLACPAGLCTVGTYAGYSYVYADGEKSGPSKICVAPESLCASGSTGAADEKGTIWGAGVGFNLDKSATPTDVQLSGTGLTYALSSLPSQGMRAQVSVGGTDYCVKLASASGTVAWTAFNSTCWDDKGTFLTGAPKTAHIGFQVTAAAAAADFDFCVKSVSF